MEIEKTNEDDCRANTFDRFKDWQAEHYERELLRVKRIQHRIESVYPAIEQLKRRSEFRAFDPCI